MIMGDLIVLLALWVVVVRDKLHPSFTVALAIGLVYGCLASYPAWLPFVILPILASLMLDSRMPVRKRLISAGVASGITAVLAVLAIIEQWNFITWFAPVRDRRLLPGWESLSAVLLLASGWGIWVLIRSWKQRFGFALFLTIDLLLVVALYGIALLDRLALYIPDKTFYFNIFVLAMLAALSFNWLWDRLPRARLQKDWVAALLVLGICLAAVAWVNSQIQSPSVYPITLDEYRVAYQTRQQMPDAELTYLVRTQTTHYWIHGCILNHTHNVVEQNEQWQARRPTYEDWIQETPQNNHALVSDLTSLPQDGRWREVIRVGNSGLIEKTPWND
jgi:hypothetical protein